MLLLLCFALLYSISLYGFVIDAEFQTESDVVPDGDMTPPATVNVSAFVYSSWRSAGSSAVIDSVFTINVRAIPDSLTYYSLSDSTHHHIPPAVPDYEEDDSFTFTKLVIWMRDNIANQGIHAQIYIPPGVYNFSDQIVMGSNISLKGAGSHQTELKFLINADTTDTTMTTLDCRKDAILVSGTDDAYKYNIGIEDLKIVRIRDGLSEREVKSRVGKHEQFDGENGYYSYWGNNIAIRRATDCWVKGGGEREHFPQSCDSRVSESYPPVPISFVLHKNYPNPFNPTTTIAFEVPEDAPAQLAIYNIRGQLVKETRYESLTKGYHRAGMGWQRPEQQVNGLRSLLL
jgi:hypothetical protein